jgi:hypothetical protein
MPAMPDTRQTLLVAAPDDPLANELVTALRASGINILVANAIALASRADEFAICTIILRPGQWRTTPVITTAMRCNPRYMIPVLAEPMSLPRAAWSTEAVNIKEPLSETVHELEAMIKKQLQTLSTDTRAASYFFRVCHNGYWAIERFDSDGGQGHQLAEGFVTAQTSYTLVATSQGDTQSLSLDGANSHNHTRFNPEDNRSHSAYDVRRIRHSRNRHILKLLFHSHLLIMLYPVPVSHSINSLAIDPRLNSSALV